MKNYYSRGISWQPVNGSPVYPDSQTQTGVWLMTLHWAYKPQLPGHGSLHFWFIQAWLMGHSEFIVHSGRQLGGDPM